MTEEFKFTKAYEKAVKLLGIRMHTSFELAQKLKRKGFPALDIQDAISQLTSQRYLDDNLTAKSYAESLVNYKTFGYYGILAKMQQKGIPNQLAVAVLAEVLPQEQEETIAKKALAKFKSRGIKAAAMLKRKGFRSNIISKLVDFSED